jgi:hypothetical protein
MNICHMIHRYLGSIDDCSNMIYLRSIDDFKYLAWVAAYSAIVKINVSNMIYFRRIDVSREDCLAWSAVLYCSNMIYLRSIDESYDKYLAWVAAHSALVNMNLGTMIYLRSIDDYFENALHE